MTTADGPVRVLVVDDQPAFRSAANLVVLMTDGFEMVAEAETAEEGLALVATHEPDLVLMDINLPGMNGLDATRFLTVDHPDTTVIVLSTYEAAEYENRALDAGAIAFISKAEFGPDTLLEAWSRSGDEDPGREPH